MSNRVDFFQQQQESLSVPAGRVLVLLAGQVCPYLEVREVVRAGWPDFSRARLILNRCGYAADKLPTTDALVEALAPGKEIWIRQAYNAEAPRVSVQGVPIFAGQIESIERQLGPGGRCVDVAARDFSAVMRRVTVYGRREVDLDGSVRFLSGAETVFNRDGRPNATTETAEYEGRCLRLFSPESQTSRFWDYAEVLFYLLSEYLPAGQLQWPGIERLRALTGVQKVRDLDLTGLDLLEAVNRCCEQTGLEFRFEGRFDSSVPGQAIVFYDPNRVRSVELSCQPEGEQLEVARTNVSRLRSVKHFWPVTHRYIGQGDFKVYEATFELVQAWDSSLEGSDYEKFSPSTNPQFYQVKDVWRKWCLNEAGDYSAAPYNRGAAQGHRI